ncbi:MAG: hypothetical protein N2314_00800 [Brevinematales bacterium]|nr:hypothetical protein [Brevinematales bacterium]
MKRKSLYWICVFFLVFGCEKAQKQEAQGPKPGVFVLGSIVLFVYRAPSNHITNVALTGDFFGWKREGFPLSYDPAVNLWRISLALEPGMYQYKYILNGSVWTNDPYNPSVSPDGKGGLNSVLQVKP